MGVDGIDKADIFDEYFDDDKPKITNFEKIKAMDIDEMAEWLNTIADDICIPCTTEAMKQWLESEVRE